MAKHIGTEMNDVDELEAIKKAIPRCQTKVIEGIGVAICLEKPEEFSSVILEFLGDR